MAVDESLKQFERISAMSEVDEPMTGVDGGESRLPLSEDETRVLELYDKLQELRLEIAIINAQQAGKGHLMRTNAPLRDHLLTRWLWHF